MRRASPSRRCCCARTRSWPAASLMPFDSPPIAPIRIIWPGSHDAGLCATGFPPMGARFRLRPSFDISGFAPTTQVVPRAFQHFGLVLADNGSDWYFSGMTDDWWGTAAGDQVVSQLKTIPAAQFDAVDESSTQAAQGSYQAVATTVLVRCTNAGVL